MEVTNHSCLICSTSFGTWKKMEEEEEGIDFSELLFRFRRGFNIFCSLIGVDMQDNPEDQFDELHKLAFHHSDNSNFETGFVKIGDSSHSPCCEKCFNMFEEILLLQKAIEESKIAQTQLARNLKRSLLRSADNRSDRYVEDDWTKIRRQLICYLKEGTSGSGAAADRYVVKNIQNDAGSKEMKEAKYEANNESEAEFSPANENNIEEESCMEIEKYGTLDLNCDNILVSEVSTQIAQQVKMRKKREPLSNADPRTQGTRRTEVRRNWRKLLQKTVAGKSGLTCVRPCSVVVKRLSKSDIASLTSSTQPLGKSFEVSSQVRKSKENAFIRKTVEVKGSQHCQKRNSLKSIDHMSTKKLKRGSLGDETFYRVSDSLILYKSTPILYSWTHFTCLEEACNKVINGSDYYFAFEELRRHVNDAHLKDTFDYEDSKRSCVECNQTFQNGYSFRYHIMRKHNYETCICTSCFKTITLSSLQRHQWSHKSAEEKAAAISAGVANALELEERKRRKCTESLKGKIECIECGKEFNSIANLQSHKITHLPKSLRETFKCPEENCDVVVLSKAALRSHIERSHRPELASRHRVCRICNARFHFRDGHRYRAHMLSHNNERPFVCEICGKGFVGKAGLQNHARAHSDERMFQCEFCTMSYKFPKNLRRHRLSAHKDLVPTPSVEERLKWTRRLEDRPDFIGPRIAYPCEYCEKVFPLRSRMTKHLTSCVKRPVQGAQS